MANSPGWMEKPATRIQILAPLTSEIDDGSTAGSASSAMPTRARVYAKRESTRWSRTTIRKATNRMTPSVAQMSWTGASSRVMSLSICSAARSRRWMTARPNPTSSATAGSISGSAYGANLRTTRWATTQSAVIQTLKVAISGRSDPVIVRSTMHWAATVMRTAKPSRAASVPRRFGGAVPAAAPRGSVAGPAVTWPPGSPPPARTTTSSVPASTWSATSNPGCGSAQSSVPPRFRWAGWVWTATRRTRVRCW